MKIKEIIDHLENIFPLSWQESYDNSGLQIGDPNIETSGILITLDVEEQVIDEAIESGCNLIISHHPLIFHPLKRLTGSSAVEKCIIKLVSNDISLYAIHTNLDNSPKGINFILAGLFGVDNPAILDPGHVGLQKVVTFCPKDSVDKVSEAMFSAGGGHIGNYDKCSFRLGGVGTFRALEGANPYVGQKNKLHEEPEVRLELIVPDYKTSSVVQAMKEAHPYEEVAYDVIMLKNVDQQVGSGVYGNLSKALTSSELIEKTRSLLGCKQVKHNSKFGNSIRRIGICGGSGAYLADVAVRKGVDALITSDIKYHQFQEAQSRILLIDAGHYETEIVMTNLIYEEIRKKFPNFACCITKHNTNPVKYS